MVEPIKFETWIQTQFPNDAVLDASPESRELQMIMAEAVMTPEVTIMSRATA
jgi:hypothetical protein